MWEVIRPQFGITQVCQQYGLPSMDYLPPTDSRYTVNLNIFTAGLNFVITVVKNIRKI